MVMKIAMVIRWGGIKPGHGKAAAENAMRGFMLLDRMVADGRILSHSEYYGMQDVGSFSIVMIEDSRLTDLLKDPEWSEYYVEADMLWEGWQFSLFQPPGEEYGTSMERWFEIAAAVA
jgi:hypothetical protein